MSTRPGNPIHKMERVEVPEHMKDEGVVCAFFSENKDLRVYLYIDDTVDVILGKGTQAHALALGIPRRAAENRGWL